MPKQATPTPRHESLSALRHLMLKAKPEVDKGELAELSMTQLRDELLACDPVNTDWVIQINRVSVMPALCGKHFVVRTASTWVCDMPFV